ncbi:hypothetical protein HYV81_04165 [Candidatus Woesearchaeota archaeon]|nr:hypothetical protein [Candidatus Woesearchaeota archaeon]
MIHYSQSSQSTKFQRNFCPWISKEKTKMIAAVHHSSAKKSSAEPLSAVQCSTSEIPILTRKISKEKIKIKKMNAFSDFETSKIKRFKY